MEIYRIVRKEEEADPNARKLPNRNEGMKLSIHVFSNVPLMSVVQSSRQLQEQRKEISEERPDEVSSSCGRRLGKGLPPPVSRQIEDFSRWVRR
jgi:hypothetical protein